MEKYISKNSEIVVDNKYLKASYDVLQHADSELFDFIVDEHKRQSDNIELIASENFVSDAVLAAVGSVLTNKYAEGYPSRRYYGGCHNVDKVEELAINRLKQLFGADHANVQAHCGTSANLAVYSAMLEPGDTILAMDLSSGGHLSHGSKVSLTGKLYNFIHYGITDDAETIDYDQVRAMALEHKPKMIVTGYSNYSRTIDFAKFAEIAKESGALLMADIAHIAGLVATGVHPSPIPYADFVTSTTHKTLRGPRGGIIMCKSEYATQIDKAIFPAMQGGPLMHVIAGKAVAFGEALRPEFSDYQKQVVTNAKVLADHLISLGYEIVGKGTDNHLLTIKLTGTGITGSELEVALDECNITVNKNSIPNDPLPPTKTSGIRIGTPAVTTRGFKEQDMIEIANCIDLVIKDINNVSEVKKRVTKLCQKYPQF